MNYRRKNGLNFLQTKYKLLDKNKFMPHIRSDGNASIPYIIVDSFRNKNPEIALIKIFNKENNLSFRIKQLKYNGNSHIISLKAEKDIKNIEIEVLSIKTKKEALYRKDSGLLKFIPKFTKKFTPIYIFNYNKNYIIGGHYKKDIIVNKKLLKDRLLYYSLGLYLAEGGKTKSSFTNSWPEAINIILNFIENNFNIKRGKINASICCNSNLKNKKEELKKFWKDKTGINNFFRSLHINKNVKSPQGILELYFNSEILKELFINLIKKLDFTNNLEFINGFLSGDGSPILQNKYSVTHHIVFDPKNSIYKQCNRLFSNYKSGMINNNRFVIYSNWNQNLFLLLNGAYSFSPMKRFRFLKYFLSLPKTKPNKSYEVKKLHKEFKELNFYLINFYKSLVDYGVYSKNEIEEFISEKIK